MTYNVGFQSRWVRRRLQRLSPASPVIPVQAEPWMDGALCTQVDPETFYPEKGQSTSDAKRVCGLCDTSSDCLAYALRNNEQFGVWGGLSSLERRRLRRAS